jgi:hypothetical protein
LEVNNKQIKLALVDSAGKIGDPLWAEAIHSPQFCVQITMITIICVIVNAMSHRVGLIFFKKYFTY